MQKTKCYIYTRVSTTMQIDGFSLEAQKNSLIEYTERNDMVIVGEYSDEGKSGKSINGRPDFMRMLRDIRNGKDKVSFVLVFKLSRFGRNAADVLNSLQEIQDYGVELICIKDGLDSSRSTGKLMIAVLSSVAEIERENILEQTMAGRLQKASEGKWNGGFAPYGYKLEKGELKIAEDEVEVIKFIFDKFVHTTMGVTGIADYLNKHGIKKKQRQKTHRDSFTPHFIKSVLDNPVYCGKIAYQRRKTEKIPGQRGASRIVKQDNYLLFDGIHEAIVSEAEWEAAHQKRLETGNRCEKVHDLEHENILSGILHCPVCGASLYGNPNRKKKKEDGSYYKGYYCYRCKHRNYVNGKPCDYRKQWNQEMVNNAVTEIIKNLIHNPKFESAIREKIESSVDTAALEAEIEALNKQLKQQIGAKNKLGQQMDNLDVNDKHYDSKYDDMQKRLDRLYEEIDSIEYEISTIQNRIDSIIQRKISGDNVYRYLLYFDKLYDKFTDMEKKQFMDSFIDRIEIYEDILPSGRFLKSIHFKFPIFYEGEEIIGLRWDKDTTVETVALLVRRDSAI